MKKSGRRSTYPLLESIGVWDGRMPYLPYHQKRVNATFNQLFPNAKPHRLKDIFTNQDFPKGKVKLRFLYDRIQFQIEWKPYQKAIFQSLQIIEDDKIEYGCKYTDRKNLNELYKKRVDSDDILIFKNGFLTDAYYSNVVIITNDQLYTPATPLLHGIMRAYLLDKEIIKTADINIEDLNGSKGVFLINALNPIQTAPFIPSEKIHS